MRADSNIPPNIAEPKSSYAMIFDRARYTVDEALESLSLFTRFLALALSVIGLNGCGTTGSTKINVTPPIHISFDFQDMRLAEDRITTKVRESAGEITRLGDDRVAPAGPLLLKTWLHNKLSADLTGKTIVLQKFSVQILDPSVHIDGQGFQTAVSSTPGADPISALLALLVIGGIESAKSEKLVEVAISGQVEGHEFFAQGNGSFKGRVSESNINSVITQALDTAVSRIEALMNH